MNILWITNNLLPEAVSLLSGNKSSFCSGGWILGAAEGVLKRVDMKLAIASISPLVSELKKVQGNLITYYIIPKGKGNNCYNPEYEETWIRIKKDWNPDIIHIHGSEFTHGMAYVKACGNKNVVVSIQGLVTEIGKHYLDGLPLQDILINYTVHDFLRNSILSEMRDYNRRGLLEQELYQNVSHVIGRTTWDHDHVMNYNRNIHYYHCNESLRQEFYSGLWSYSECQKHTIFLSQSYYPLKALHQVLKALPSVIAMYPDTKVRIVGKDITDGSTFRKRVERSGYGKIINKLIKQYGLDENVEFLGPLSASQMKEEYLKCNVFICPSAIENSSNSIAEAQILGTPVIASYAGGNPTMMEGCEKSMYRFEDIDHLSYLITEAFENRIYKKDIEEVRLRHDKQINSDMLISIYNDIINS